MVVDEPPKRVVRAVKATRITMKPDVSDQEISSFVPLCTCTSASQTGEEANIKDVLKARFKEASTIKVQDVSGGCGAMFEVWVESHEFEGLSTVKQHRLITQTLKEQIKNMHGLRISTSVPQNGSS